jgi:uncharacterized protein (DUF488 family)
MPKTQIIHMIGHSTHSLSAFIALLRQHSVELVVDVRTKPLSRRVPQFNKARLEASLRENGIEYQWERTLGGFQPMACSEILQVIERLLCAQQGLCFMCSESDFRKCHRHYLLAPLLQGLGYRIYQILPDGEVVEDVHLLPLRRKAPQQESACRPFNIPRQ